MKKISMFLFAMIMLLSFSLPCFAVTFSDVAENAWYYEFVTDLSDKQVINGFPDGTFKPDDGVTVGQFLKLIITASISDLRLDLIETPINHWAAPYLKVAENCGVLQEGEYKAEDLDRAITRIEIVSILTRCDIIIKRTPQTSSTRVFTDTDDISANELIYLSHAVGIGVINGDPAGTFRPHDGLRRSECAKVIYTYTNR